MYKAEKFFRNYFFSLAGKIIIVLFIFISFVALVISTTVKVHSESDVSYKQQSIFNDAGLRAGSIRIISESMVIEKPSVIAMSFEVDKVTPTPTPLFIADNADVWMRLAECESHKNWKADTGNGYYGGLQFSMGAWLTTGGQGKPSDASGEEQIMRGKILQQKRGWGPWGGCSKKLGLL